MHKRGKWENAMAAIATVRVHIYSTRQKSSFSRLPVRPGDPDVGCFSVIVICGCSSSHRFSSCFAFIHHINGIVRELEYIHRCTVDHDPSLEKPNLYILRVKSIKKLSTPLVLVVMPHPLLSNIYNLYPFMPNKWMGWDYDALRVLHDVWWIVHMRSSSLLVLFLMLILWTWCSLMWVLSSSVCELIMPKSSKFIWK